MMTEPYASYFRALLRVAQARQIAFWEFSNLDLDRPAPMGRYFAGDDPASARFILDDNLTDQERVMALTHELGHAELHPPGSGDAPVDLEPEDRVVHTVARIVCDEFGITDYYDVMAARRVKYCPAAEELSKDERTCAAELVARLITLICSTQ